jgi:signal transduction histidine kinase
MLTVSWPAVVSFASGAGTLGLIGAIYEYRGKPGVAWFVAALCAQAAWAILYGVALFVFDPSLRRLLEVAIWVPVSWMGFLFLGFALDYTGRGDVVRSRAFAALATVPVASTLLVLTNENHHLVWTGFRVDPAYGAATVSYSFGPWAYFMVTAGLVFAAVGVLLLVDAILAYGPLYFREAAAVGVSAVPIAAGVVVWALDLGGVSPLNPVPLAFLPHIALDAYAFAGTKMFESNPTTLRAAERSAVDDLETPVVVLDRRDRVVRGNRAARAAFGLDDADLIEDPVRAVFGDEFAAESGAEVSATVGGRQRRFVVSASPLTDPTGTRVGRTLVFQDVTEERRREQRLQVLNRVLRHNLRNEMTTVGGYASMIEERVEDPELREGASIIAERSQTLVDIGEKAREFERVVDGERATDPVDLRALLSEAADGVAAGFPDGRATVGGDAREVESDPELLRLVFENLIENGLEHADTDRPHVEVTVSVTDDGGATVEVRDNGPGIPDQEVATIRSEREEPLQHGQGIGLWIVQWGVATLGGAVTFADHDSGTVVTVRIPDRGAASAVPSRRARRDR